MKILVTAMNSAALVTETKRWRVRNAVGAYVAAMRDLGHDVDWRRTMIDDDVTGYDVVIANVVPPLSLVATDGIPVVKMMVEANRAGVPVITSIDDWNTDNVTRRVQRNGENPGLILGKDWHAKKPGYDWAMADRQRWIDTCFEFAETKFPTLVCAYEFGDPFALAKLGRRLPGDLIQLDPTPYVEHDYHPRLMADRERRWVLGSLACHNRWLIEQPWTWPGDYYLTVEPKSRVHPQWTIQPPMKQDQIIRRFGEVWGVVLQPYKRMLGSGWWRDRWVTAPRSGAVLFCDPADAGRLGADFRHQIGDIEGMTTPELGALAVRQRSEIESWLWSRQRLQRALAEVL